MGNDGGSIPKRRELVKEAARIPTSAELKESQQEQQEYNWTTDPISGRPLAQPVISDATGKLYNKDTILEYLVEGSRKEDAEALTRGAIKSLKDVVEVKFEVDAGGSTKTDVSTHHQSWKCPITGDRLGPSSKAVYLVPCGHAFSGTAIKELSSEKCLICETEYASNDVIPILPTSEIDIARLSLRVKTLQESGLTHSLKKASGGGKKRKKREEAPAEVLNVVDGTEVKNSHLRSSTPLSAVIGKHDTSGINNSSTASLTAKVMQEQDLAKKRKKDSDHVRGLFSSRDQSKPVGQGRDFMTRGFSIASESKR